VYCSKCGSEISAAATFCATCGQPIAGLVPVPPVPIAAPPTYTTAPVAPAAGGGNVAYAGFWLRFVGWLIDSFVSGFAFVVLLIPLFVLTGAGAALSRIGSGEDISDEAAAFLGIGFLSGFFGILLVVSWLYYALSESSSWQGTVGKKILNMYVTDISGKPISFGRASGRFFARIITRMIPLGIGYIMAGFTEKRQAIHDMIASCLVLRKG